ncbi:MAG: hypothetical protein ABEJ31_06975 [Haloarculaceae archaeon]
MGDSYVVAIKPSARRTNARAGRWVQERGARARFASKALAREWARGLRSPGAPVWIQDAAPADESDADGYLVGGDRPAPSATGSAARQRGLSGEFSDSRHEGDH